MSWDVIIPFLAADRAASPRPGGLRHLGERFAARLRRESRPDAKRSPDVTIAEKSLQVAVAQHRAGPGRRHRAKRSRFWTLGCRTARAWRRCFHPARSTAPRSRSGSFRASATRRGTRRVGTLPPDVGHAAAAGRHRAARTCSSPADGRRQDHAAERLGALHRRRRANRGDRRHLRNPDRQAESRAPGSPARSSRDLPAVTIRDLLKATLRLRPDRILVGEVRGGEAFDLLQALTPAIAARFPRFTRTPRPKASSASRPVS